MIGRGFGAAFVWGLRLTCRPLRLVLVGGAACALGGVLAVGQVGAHHWDRPNDAWLDLWLVLDDNLLTYLLPLIALLIIAQGFRAEIGRQTLVYHLVRPVSRSTLFFARFLSGVVPATLLGTLALVVTCLAGGLDLPQHVWLSLPLTALTAAVTVGAVYYLATTLLPGGTIVALIYTFVVEPLVSAQSGSMQKLSIMFHVRGVHHAMVDGFFAGKSKAIQQALHPPPQIDWERLLVWKDAAALAKLAQKVAYDPLAKALATCAIIAAAALLVGAWKIAHRDFPLKG